MKSRTRLKNISDEEKVKYDLESYFAAERRGVSVEEFSAPYGSVIEEAPHYVAATLHNGDDGCVVEYSYIDGTLSVFPI